MSRLASGVQALVVAVLAAALAVPAAGQVRKSARRGRKPAQAGSSWPSFESRHADWARRKEIAAESGLAGPDPLSQYLVGEVVVTGVFEADSGHGVFLYAAPSGTTFFVAPGAILFNGRLVEIVEVSGGFVDDTQVVFVERTDKVGERRIVKRIEAAPMPEPAAPDGGGAA